MKFVYLSSLFMACALSVGAQETSKDIYQFADPGFEEEWVEGKIDGKNSGYYEPGNGWHSFASATGRMASIGQSMSPQPERILKSDAPENVHSGNASVYLWSKNVDFGFFKTKANGNLTTGIVNMEGMTATDHSNYNFTKRGSDNCLEFAGTPDAVTFWAKFEAGSGNTAKQGRGKFILHDDYDYKDPEGYFTTENAGHRIALAEQLIDEGKKEWTQYTKEFTYDERTSVPTKQYLLASFTTNPTPGGSYNDKLYIDDVYFIYYSDLKSLSYDGTPINIEDPENIQIAAKDFDLSKVSCTSGKGADIQTSYDEGTRILTITIEGNDISVNPENRHEYSVKIVPPASEVTLTDNRLIKVDMGTIFPSINSVTISESESKDGTVAFTMKNFVFAGEMPVGDVTLTGATLSYADNGSINITAPEQELPLLGGVIYTKVSLSGNVAVVNGKKELTADVNIKWYQNPADMEHYAPIQVAVSAIPFKTTLEGKTLKVTGSVAADEVAAVIPTDANSLAAPVKVDVNVVDLTETALTGNITSSAFEAKNPNTLFYAAEGATTFTGDNVVKGTECENLVLTDGLTFNAPEGFEATNVTFNRKFTTGNLSTVVLPFSFDAADVNGTVYKLESVENGVLSFKSVEGTADANVPYLVQTEGENLFKETFKGATVAPTPETVENRIIGTGVTHVGNFGETMEITSDDQTSWYGYNTKGSFVKVLSGTVKPFRSAIKSTGAAPSSFALKLDGTVTGILNLENPNAKVDVYTVSGVCVRKNVPAASALNGLSRGVYIVGGQKVVK